MHDVIRNSVGLLTRSTNTPCRLCFWLKTCAPWSSAKDRVIGYDRCWAFCSVVLAMMYLENTRSHQQTKRAPRLRGFSTYYFRDIVCRAWTIQNGRWLHMFFRSTSKRPAQIFSNPVPQQEVPFKILNCMFIFMQENWLIIFEELAALRSFLIRWINLQPQLLVTVYDQSNHI